VADQSLTKVYNIPFDGFVIDEESNVLAFESIAVIADNHNWNFCHGVIAVEKSATTFTVTLVFLPSHRFISLKLTDPDAIFFVETVNQSIINLTLVTLLLLTFEAPV